MEANQTNQNISIFNIGEHQDELNNQMFKGGYETKLFDPKLQNAQDSLTFIIRPVPYIHNPLQSLIQRSYYVLPDIAGNNVYFDSRTTFNKPAQGHFEFCEVSDLWFKLRQSSDPAVQKRADFLRLQRANYAYVLIVNFPKDASLNGQIVPMRLPVEMIKAFNKMANPTKDDIAIGAKPVQPFDIINGCNIKCEVTGKMVGNTLMRDWAITVQNPSVLTLPIGANGAYVPVNQTDPVSVETYFKDHQTEVLDEVYGYKEPNIDTKRRMKGVLMSLVQDLPGLPAVVAEYFPELNLHMATDQDAQPQPQAINMNAAGTMPGFNVQPQNGPQVQPEAQPIQVQPQAPVQQQMQPQATAEPSVAPQVQTGPTIEPKVQPIAAPQAQPNVAAQPQEQPMQPAPQVQPAEPQVQAQPTVNAEPQVQAQPQMQPQASPQMIGGIVIP